MNRSKQRRRFGTILLTVAILFVIRLIFVADPFSNLLVRATNPISNIFGKLYFNQEKAVPYSKDDLKKLKASDDESIKEENLSLKNQLNFVDSQQYQFVGADIVSKTVDTYRKTVWINRGSKDGIKGDMPVIAEGFLVGNTHQIYEDNSSVILIGDPDFRAAAVIEGADVSGIVSSKSGGIVIDKVPVIDDGLLQKRVVTSGLGELFPSGLVIGVVGSRISGDKEVMHTYALRTPIKVDFLNNVVVLKTK
ncbi:rod shape-determining protein MreC [Candidatus Saccharibacteria bacterium CPR2]|nr:rod shape-determining protein MreC [Candidatus Saccharibacteria bacterium CPR2]